MCVYIDIEIYIIYTPNSRSQITAFNQEREHSHFEWSSVSEQERATLSRKKTSYSGVFFNCCFIIDYGTSAKK